MKGASGLLLIAILIVSMGTARASLVIAKLETNCVTIATDSKVSGYRLASSNQTIQKVIPLPGHAHAAFTGYVGNSKVGYFLPNMILESRRDSEPLEKTARKFQNSLQRFLAETITQARMANPDMTPREVIDNAAQVLFFGFEEQVLKAYHVHATPMLMAGNFQISTVVTPIPAGQTLILGSQKAQETISAQLQQWRDQKVFFQDTPAKLMMLMKLGIRADQSTVGPPIVMLQVEPFQSQWLYSPPGKEPIKWKRVTAGGSTQTLSRE